MARKRRVAPGQAEMFRLERAEEARQEAPLREDLPPLSPRQLPPELLARRALWEAEAREAHQRVREIAGQTSLALLLGVDASIPFWAHGLRTVLDLDGWVLACREKELEVKVGRKQGKRAVTLLFNWWRERFLQTLQQIRTE